MLGEVQRQFVGSISEEGRGGGSIDKRTMVSLSQTRKMLRFCSRLNDYWRRKSMNLKPLRVSWPTKSLIDQSVLSRLGLGVLNVLSGWFIHYCPGVSIEMTALLCRRFWRRYEGKQGSSDSQSARRRLQSCESTWRWV